MSSSSCGPLEEALEHPELVEDLHRRGVDRVAAEIAEEVGMLFEHLHRDAGAGEQQPGHHPRGAAADDQDVGHAAPRKVAKVTKVAKVSELGTISPGRWRCRE